MKPDGPGPDDQFDIAVYDRGAPALQPLRDEVGEDTFFQLLQGWPAEHAYGNANVGDFVRYAERLSGKPLAALFDTWLYQPSRPAPPAAATRGSPGARCRRGRRLGSSAPPPGSRSRRRTPCTTTGTTAMKAAGGRRVTPPADVSRSVGAAGVQPFRRAPAARAPRPAVRDTARAARARGR